MEIVAYVTDKHFNVDCVYFDGGRIVSHLNQFYDKLPYVF